MKKALIIGGAGFVGKHLADHIHNIYGWDLHITKMKQEELAIPYVSISDLDILDQEQMNSLLSQIKPDYIFHLAAQSSVALSWKNPQLTIDVNIKGSLNLLEALKDINPRPRTLLIGSSEEYGHVKEYNRPVSEENPLRPGNIYAVTKICQNMLGKIYTDAYGLDVIGIRAFNHIGPGQTESFVVADFCKQVAEIESNQKSPILAVGDLSAKRDFTDVREIVKAYVLLAINGEKGETYNVGSGNALSIREILDKIIEKSLRTDIEIRVDAQKLRPIEIPVIQADLSKLEALLGWKPEWDLDNTIEDTLQYWRMKMTEEMK